MEKWYNIGDYYNMYEEIVVKFICGDKNMVVVKLKNVTHVMTEEEWGLVFGRRHPERWSNRKKKKKTA